MEGAPANEDQSFMFISYPAFSRVQPDHDVLGFSVVGDEHL